MMKITTLALTLVSSFAIADIGHSMNIKTFNNRNDWVNAVNGGHNYESFSNSNTEFNFSGAGYRGIWSGKLQGRLKPNAPLNIEYNVTGKSLTAFGGLFDMRPSGYGSGASLNFGINNENFALKIPGKTYLQFFGFVTDESFTNLQLTSKGIETFNVDYFKYKSIDNPTVKSVPEPLTIVGTILSGVLGIALKKRKLILKTVES